MMKIIQVTDAHLTGTGRRLHDLEPEKRLAACVHDINDHHGDADLCIVTGDLTDTGEISAYQQVREHLSMLSMPYHLLPGNHDDRANLISVFPEAPRDENGFVQAVFDYPAGVFILLDTIEPFASWGSYCQKRVSWLSRQLDASAGRPVYLFMHHPPLDIGIPSLDSIKLLDAGRLRKILGNYKNIRHLFFGHVHRPVSGSWCGIPFSALKGLNHQVRLDLHARDHIPISHEPPAYAVILLGPDQTTVHFHDFLDRSGLPPFPPNPDAPNCLNGNSKL